MTGFRPGDRVAYCLVWNSYAEFAVVPAWQFVHVSPAVPFSLAAAATFQGFTAHYLATDVGRPVRLDLASYPHLPQLAVKTTAAADYAVLVPEVAA